MNEPRDFAEYVERSHKNQRVFGFGFGVSMALPCPFCAAPDFLVYRITRSGEFCNECKAKAKAGRCG